MKKKMIAVAVCAAIIGIFFLTIYLLKDPYLRGKHLLRNCKEEMEVVSEYLIAKNKIAFYTQGKYSHAYYKKYDLPSEIEQGMESYFEENTRGYINVITRDSFLAYGIDSKDLPEEIAVMFYVGSEPYEKDTETGNELDKYIYLCYTHSSEQEISRFFENDIMEHEVSYISPNWYIVTQAGR